MKEEIRECPNCHEEEFRPVLIGNDKDGWDKTGEWECDSCDYQDHDPKEIKKSNRPSYFNNLPSELQSVRKWIELSEEMEKENNKPVVHKHHTPTFKEIQEDKLRI